MTSIKKTYAKKILILVLIFLSLAYASETQPSGKKPDLLSVNFVSGPEIEATYEIRFAPGTFQLSDGQIIGVYDNGALKYKLIAENTSNIASGTLRVKIPRLQANRTIGILLRNPHETSAIRYVTLQLQSSEMGGRFECVNCSHIFGDGVYSDSYSVKHTNSGITQISGTDTITISQPNAGKTPCNARDFIFTGSQASWLDPQTEEPTSGHGTVNITANPTVNALLRAPNNKLTVNWTLPPLHVDRYYQVLLRGVEIIGVCADRVVQ